MARIAGIDIPREKRVEIALTYIYGIGLPTSQKILAQANVNPDTRVRDLTEEQVNRLREIIDRRYKVEGDLRREVALNIKRLRRSARTAACATGATCPCAASAPRPTPAQRRGPKKTVGVRRKKPRPERRGTPTSMAERKRAAKKRRRETEERAAGPRPHPGELQQHDHHDHRPRRRRRRWGSAGVAGFKGSRKSTPYAAALSRRRRRASGRWSTACARSRSS